MVLPEQILIADGDSREVDALSVDDLHVHSFGIIPQVDQPLTHEPQEKTHSAENSDCPQYSVKQEGRERSDNQMITMLGDNIGICDTYRLEM